MLPLVLGSAASPFEATRQPCSGPPKADDPRPPSHRYISDDAKAGYRGHSYGKTPNGLDIHVFDCPGDKLVTLWSSRFGVGKDNPSSSVIPVDADYGKLQERSMVQIDMYNINEFEVG